ncbi:MAG: LytTR family DNA-binding domain-containing protein [Arcobacteraceae bacterium]|jgi:two-component system LytT family response regulator|nr:LytTR family DNA-binding domain-containing protein [Arcobacteraceae bacterium]
MKIAIIDDEQLALDRLQRILNELGYTDITASSNPDIVFDSKYDLLFLDIDMPSIKGTELAKKIKSIYPDIAIIFQTAYGEFALEAFDIGSIDYILKPTEKSRVLQSISRISSRNNTITKLVTKLGNETYIIDPKDVYFIQADLNEVIVKTKTSNAYMQKNISILEQELKDYGFVRVHRSYLVNINKIKNMTTVEASKFEIKFIDIYDTITTSKDGAKFLRNYLGEIGV